MYSDPSGLSIDMGKAKTDPSMKYLDPVTKNPKSGPSFIPNMYWMKILIISIFIITVALLILLIMVLCSTVETRQRIIDGNRNSEAETPCLTLTCLQVAVEIKNSINTSVDPCDDFRQFACGKWQSEQIIPQGNSKYSVSDVLDSHFYKKQKKLIEGSEFKSMSPVYSKAIRLYNSCKNLDTINALGSKPLENYVKNLFGKYGGWEMQVDDMYSSLSKWDLQKVIQDPLIENSIFYITVEQDFKNTSRNLFSVDYLLLFLKKHVLRNPTKPENKKIIDAYREFMYEIGRLLNLKKNKFDQFDEILKLGIKISKTYPTDEELKISENTYYRMKITELQSKYCPEFNWKEIFKRRMEMVKLQMKDDMDVAVVSPVHLREICKLFKYDEKTLRIIHNYIIWKSVHSKIEYLSEDFQRASDKFQKIYTGATGKKNRWKHCISKTEDHMGLILFNMYIHKNLNKHTKPQVTEIINLLKAKFHENLISNSWMDEKTKYHAIKKLEAISPLIGFSENILNISYLEKTFEDIEIKEENYFENIIKFKNREIYKSFEKINKSPENSTMESLSEVDAYYNFLRNEVIFPPGILQSPFFEPGFPRSLNHGGIGYVMGHEIIHAFDDSGSKFDFQGNLRLWWTNETRKLFNAKSECFVKQYSKYTMHGHYMKGKTGLGENIADNGGLRLSYQVYKDVEKKYGKEKRLPGLNYTPDQLLFITFARTWCEVRTKESAIIQILSDVHVPSQYRIIGTLSNLEEFAEAFNCPLGSPMNPREKCILW